MPSSYWGNRLAAILVVSIAVLAVFWTGWWSIKLYTEQRVAEVYEGKNEAQEKTNVAIETCVDQSPSNLAQCARDAILTEEKQTLETRDLYAQEWMAHWAFLMFVSAAFSTVTSAYGIYLLYATWTATRETVAIARADQRPWLKLTIGVVDQVIFDGQNVRVSVLWTVENVGRSPATFVNIEVSAAPFAHNFTARMRARSFATNFAFKGLSNQSLMLFPGDKESGIYNLPVDPGNIDEIMRDLPENGDYLPEICAFAAYRMSRTDEVMITNTTVSLERRSPNGLGFNIRELPLLASEFTLRRSLHTEHAT